VDHDQVAIEGLGHILKVKGRKTVGRTSILNRGYFFSLLISNASWKYCSIVYQ